MKRLLGTLLVMLAVLPVLAQPAGQGVVTGLNPRTALDPGFNHVMTCIYECEPLLLDMLFPTLYATDPLTGFIVPAAADNTGLVLDPTMTAAQTQEIRLRDDLLWSDGTPVTAYDVLWNMLNLSETSFFPLLRDQVARLMVTDAHTLAIEFTDPDCAVPAALNVRIFPVHVYLPEFAARVDRLREADATPLSIEDWIYSGIFQGTRLTPQPDAIPVTAGPFEVESIIPFEAVRFVSDGAEFVYADRQPNVSRVEQFIAGDTDYLINPPYSRIADLLANEAFQVAVTPSTSWTALLFNWADPQRPRGAFYADGTPREQFPNLLTTDMTIRSAISHAIDVPAIIDQYYMGYAEPLASLWPPTSWAHDATRTPVMQYDFREAERLLREAGWWDADRDGIRECRDCTTMPIGTRLQLRMSVDAPLDRPAAIIIQQLRRVGIEAVMFDEGAAAQTFDLHLASFRTPPDQDPDLMSYVFDHRTDSFNEKSYRTNYGSYHNEAVEAMFADARAIGACSMDERRAAYSALQDTFDETLTVLPLFVQSDISFAQPTIRGFAPLPGKPLWNLRDWTVLP